MPSRSISTTLTRSSRTGSASTRNSSSRWDWPFTDAEGYIALYNDAAVALWGREPEPGKDLWCGSWKIFTIEGAPMPLDEYPMELGANGAISKPFDPFPLIYAVRGLATQQAWPADLQR